MYLLGLVEINAFTNLQFCWDILGGYDTLSVNLDQVSDKLVVINTPAAPIPNGKIGERIESAGVAMIVVKADKVQKAGFTTAKAGNVILDLDVVIQNSGRKETVPYNSLYFKLKDGSGYEYSTSF